MNKKLTILAFLLVLSGCAATDSTNTDTSSDTTDQTEETNTSEESTESTDESANEEEASDATTITFGDTITSTDDSVQIDGNKVTVTEAGEYTLTGSSEDANIEFNVGEEDDLIINIEDLTLTASEDAPIHVAEGKNLEVNLIGESTLTDSESNQEMQAPIFIDEVETTIQGDGTLNLVGNAQEGFENNNEMTIESGTINISAPDDGINTGDGLVINGGTINIDCEGDGLDSNGYLEINGGTMIVSGGNNGNGPVDYGDNAEDYFELNGGTLISAGGNMGVTPSERTQNYVSSTTSGQTITVNDTEYDMGKEFSYIFVSTPDIEASSDVSIDGTEVTDEMNSTATSMGGGGRPEEMEGEMTPPSGF